MCASTANDSTCIYESRPFLTKNGHHASLLKHYFKDNHISTLRKTSQFNIYFKDILASFGDLYR